MPDLLQPLCVGCVELAASGSELVVPPQPIACIQPVSVWVSSAWNWPCTDHSTRGQLTSWPGSVPTLLSSQLSWRAPGTSVSVPTPGADDPFLGQLLKRGGLERGGWKLSLGFRQPGSQFQPIWVSFEPAAPPVSFLFCLFLLFIDIELYQCMEFPEMWKL